MSEHQQVNRATSRQDEHEVLHLSAGQTQSATNDAAEGFDALLDEIDGLLETNAAEYVRSFVQKGGQ